MNLTLALLLPLVAANFDTQKEAAVEVDSLKKTVSTLVGLCDVGDQFEKRDCKSAMKAKAKKLRAQGTQYIYLGPQERGLKLEGPRGSKVRVLWTPIVDAGDGLAITLVKPRRLSKAGNVVVPTKPLDLELAPGVLDTEINRFIRTGQVTIELVGSFGQTWRLKRKGKKVEGVIFKPSAIRLAHARTGKTLAEISD